MKKGTSYTSKMLYIFSKKPEVAGAARFVLLLPVLEERDDSISFGNACKSDLK